MLKACNVKRNFFFKTERFVNALCKDIVFVHGTGYLANLKFHKSVIFQKFLHFLRERHELINLKLFINRFFMIRLHVYKLKF